MIQQIMNSVAMSASILLLCLVYLIFTRVFGKPNAATKTPITVWIFDFLVWPIGIVAFFAVLTEILRFTTVPESASN